MGPKIPEPRLFKQTLSEVFLCQDFADEIKVPKQSHLKYRNNQNEADDLTTGVL